MNHRAALVGLLAVGVAGGGMYVVNGGDAESRVPFETTRALVERKAPARQSPPEGSDDTADLAGYKLVVDRYNLALQRSFDDHDEVGAGATRRRALKPIRYERTVVRPFRETVSDGPRRRMGFVRDAKGGQERVTLIRPVADDARALTYPGPAVATEQYRVVAGRPCRVTTFARAEYCVDGAGLVLVKRLKEIVEIVRSVKPLAAAESAAALRDQLAPGFTNTNVGSLRPIDPDSAPPGTDWALPEVPEGFELIGRYAHVPLTDEVLKRNSRKVTAGVVDVYVRGADAFVVDRGGQLDLSAVDDKDLGSLTAVTKINLGALGEAEVGTAGTNPFAYREVRARPAINKYVVVAGTLPTDELVALAQSLRSYPGTAIKYLDR